MSFILSTAVLRSIKFCLIRIWLSKSSPSSFGRSYGPKTWQSVATANCHLLGGAVQETSRCQQQQEPEERSEERRIQRAACFRLLPLIFNPFNEEARFSLLLRAMSRSSIFSISLVAPPILYAPLQLPLLEPPPLFSLASLVSLSVSSASPLPRSLLTTIKPFVFTSQIHHPPGHLSVVL